MEPDPKVIEIGAAILQEEDRSCWSRGDDGDERSGMAYEKVAARMFAAMRSAEAGKPDPQVDYSFLTEQQYEEIFVHHCYPNSKDVTP